MSKNIRNLILDAINTDDSFGEKNSKNIIKIYMNATHLEKEKIDRIFIDLCGYSLGTLCEYEDNSILYVQKSERTIARQSSI